MVVPRELERERFGRKGAARLVVRRDDGRPTAQAKPGRGQAALAQAYDDHPLADELRHLRVPSISSSCAIRQRNFKLERLKSAKRMEMIQNRTMIFGSGHPFFS